MRFLSLSRPWPWAILYAGKHVENRRWSPPISQIGQRIALHAAKSWDASAIDFCRRLGGKAAEIPLRNEDHPSGLIVGVATIDRVVTDDLATYPTAVLSSSLSPDQRPWFFGPCGWVLRDVELLLAPVPQVGAQGLRELAPAVNELVMNQLGAARIAAGG